MQLDLFFGDEHLCQQGLTALEYDPQDPITDVERALINTGR